MEMSQGRVFVLKLNAAVSVASREYCAPCSLFHPCRNKKQKRQKGNVRREQRVVFSLPGIGVAARNICPFLFFCKLLVCGPLSRERLVGILQAGGRVRSLGCARAWMDAGDARLILICLLVRLGVDALRTLQPAAAAAAAAEVH